jgi:hypothetical protein
MFNELLTNFFFGLLLVIVLFSFYSYFWFFPSPFNTNFLSILFNRRDYASEYPFDSLLRCFMFSVVGFVLQITIPLACVMLKKFLTAQLSILDSLMICATPEIYAFCVHIIKLWIACTGRQTIEYIIYPGSNNEENDEEFVNGYSFLEQEYRDFRMELVTASGGKAYKIHYKLDPYKGSLIKEIIEVLPASIGLLIICFTGGLFGWLLTQNITLGL